MKTYIGIRLYELEKDRYYIDHKGEIYDLKRNTIIKQHLNTGYKRVSLRTRDNHQKSYYVHVLVAISFLGDKSSDMTVNHKDGDKVNNSIYNLEWVSHRENMKHAINIGLIKNKKSYDKETVKKVCELLEKNKTAEEISVITGMNKSSIYSIRDGTNWTDISSNYNISRTKYNKLNKNTVHVICERIGNGDKLTTISKDMNIPYTTIGSIKQKISWVGISNKYF
jgi:hypothetical protein